MRVSALTAACFGGALVVGVGACSSSDSTGGGGAGAGGTAGTGGASGASGMSGSAGASGAGGAAGCCPAQTPTGQVCCRDRAMNECTCDELGCWQGTQHCFCGREGRVLPIVGPSPMRVPSCDPAPGEVCCVGGVGDPVCGCSMGTTECGFESFEIAGCSESDPGVCPDSADVCE